MAWAQLGVINLWSLRSRLIKLKVHKSYAKVFETTKIQSQVWITELINSPID